MTDETPSHSAAVPPAVTTPEERAAYERAARWAGIRQRQAAHDGASVVEAYCRGYLDGMREDTERSADAERSTDAGAPADASVREAGAPADAGAALTRAELELRARLEGYADGQRWRERGKLGGLVRLAILQSGKSARRFATEDLVREHDKVRAWQTYKSNVPDVVADELLRRLNALEARS